MKTSLRLFFSIFFLIFFISVADAQKPAFYNDIQAFKSADSSHFPPAHAILFVGSSSFTKWKDVQDYFPGFPIINRGFGGSTLPDVIRYAPEIIFPYKPTQVVIYCGENDLASSDTVTARLVFERFKHLFFLIRKNIPQAKITYVSMKPSPSRRKLMQKMQQGNAMIKGFLQQQSNSSFINVFDRMLDANGQPLKNIYLSDSLHMNTKGYEVWQKIMRPYLKK
jgi:lysophospholipase L1-like esterase